MTDSAKRPHRLLVGPPLDQEQKEQMNEKWAYTLNQFHRKNDIKRTALKIIADEWPDLPPYNLTLWSYPTIPFKRKWDREVKRDSEGE